MRKIATLVTTILILWGTSMTAQELKTISLPEPALANDKPLMQAVKERKSTREFADKQLSLQDLGNVLWCANGVNRPEEDRRTSPSAMNKQSIDVYAVIKDGVYLYDAARHELTPVAAGDFREAAGMQDYVATAPLNLIYVSDLNKLDMIEDEQDRLLMACADAAHCSENVYLYGAAAGLAVVIRGSVDGDKLKEPLKLKPGQRVMLGQTVGYFKE